MTVPSTPLESATGRVEPRLTVKRLYWCFVACYFLVWIALPWWVDRQAPNENLSLLAAARTLEWMYSERSSFAVWMAHAAFAFLPANVATTYVLGAICTAIMLVAAWLIAHETMDVQRAMLAVLFISCCTYYTNRLHFFGDNAALTAMSSLVVFSLWRALRTQGIRWWILTGVLWGLGLLAKPLMVVTIGCGLIAARSIEPRRERPHASSVAMALVACGIVITPSAIAWLKSAPPDIVLHTWRELLPMLSRPRRVINFSADQLLRLVPLLFLLGILMRTRALQVARASSGSMNLPSLMAVRFLAMHAWGTLAAILAIGVLGVDLQAHWGTAFLWLLPVWFVSTRRGARFASIDFEHVLVCVALTHVVMVVGYVLDW